MDPIFEQAPVPLLVENQSGNILWSNSAFQEAFGELQSASALSALADNNHKNSQAVENGGHHYSISRQQITYCAQKAQLLWLLPSANSKEHEHDPLTGLLSYNSFFRLLEESWQEVRDNSSALGVLTINLSGFSVLNEVLGSAACDDLLRQVANRFNKCLDEESLFSRVNGDQFLISTRGAIDVSDLHPSSIYARSESLIHRIVNDLGKPFEALGRPIILKAVMGISTSSISESLTELIASSHRAMMQAKSAPEQDWVAFNREMLKIQEQQKVLAVELADALKNESLSLLYQPFVSLKTGKLVGLEALIRWDHPTRGFLTPSQFLHTAKVSNMMFPIGRWVVDKVVKIAAAHPSLVFVLNLSAQQLMDPMFFDVLKQTLEETKAKPDSIVIDILESSNSTTLDSAKQVLEELSRAGIGLSLDDADWDTKSLMMLSALSLRYVKVDRQIVSNLDEDNTRAFCKAILALASCLGRKSLAVGVESIEQSRFLQQFGCDWGQGNFYAHPSQPTQINSWLAKPFLV